MIVTAIKLTTVLELSQPEQAREHLVPFLGPCAQRAEVELTRLQPPDCYWTVYRCGAQRVTLKSFFAQQAFDQFVAELRAFYPDRLDAPWHEEGGIVVRPEISSVLWSFPFDPQLPNLAHCLDVAWIASLLPRPIRPNLEVDPVSYNPEIGAVFSYRDREHGRIVAYGKVVREDNSGRIYAVMHELLNGTARERGRPCLAHPLAYRPEVGLLLQAPIPGQTVPPQRNRRVFFELARHAGRALALVHASELPFGPSRSLDDALGRLRAGLPDLALAAPGLHGAMRDLVAQVASRADRNPAGPSVPSHGDYKWDQFLRHRGRFGLIDFELFCQAEPALDLGYFCAYLATPRPDDWREASAVEWLRRRFLRAYDSSSPWPVDLDRVALHEAATLGIRAMSYVWWYQPGWSEQASELIDLAFERMVNPAGIPQSAGRPRISGAQTRRLARRPRQAHPPEAKAFDPLVASDRPATGKPEDSPSSTAEQDGLKPLIVAAALLVVLLAIAILRKAGRAWR